jgi:hypothetical protein
MENVMNQIKRKRRLSPLEAAVIGNILYIVLVLIFKNVFDAIRSDSFDYLFSSVQFIAVAIFWITLFSICFKSIGGNEKPKTFKYVFFSLVPIMLLTTALTLVSSIMPGQDTSSIWNQFALLAAPTIFWYLPYGLIYQLIGSETSIFVFFAIALAFTIAFQVIGIILGRILGRKYWEETKAEDQRDLEYALESKKEKKKSRKKSKLPKYGSIGMEGLSNEQINEGFTPRDTDDMIMTEVIFDDAYSEQTREKRDKSETGLFQKVSTTDHDSRLTAERISEIEAMRIQPAAIPQLDTDVPETQEKSKWQVPEPVSLADLNKGLNNQPETEDKSFLMETSAVRIISEEDIEEYYRNKK